MNWWLPHKFEEKQPALQARMQVIRSLRGFFDSQGFHEVETPILQICPSVDTHIHGIRADVLERDLQTAHERYLQTSPEFAMKKLLVAGCEQIYQICKVFRNGEMGRLHSPEFTMLEWYRTGCDYTVLMADCEALLKKVLKASGAEVFRHKDVSCDPFKKWQKISVAEAFEQYAEIDLAAFLPEVCDDGKKKAFASIIEEQNIRTAPDDRWDDLFFRVMAEKIEPHLGEGVPCILYDYPASMAALARKKPTDPRWAERFELYVCGVELANAFSELTDVEEQRARIEADMALKREIYGFDTPIDEDFLKALEHGMPESAGIALGVDRLVMLASGAEDIQQVLWAE